ncbi:MAG: large-conductance mechanosensitive channel protein MscL [Oscillospiraceae bacterium]|nr:large-conductance mechanosensitive channel protein MscL [Oscillospiraceae bacterium]
MFSEFKKFISRGNVLDLAVGVIIGGAFTSIVTSLVNDVVMPIISLIIGGINFSDLKIVIRAAEGDVAETALRYGAFIQSIINFLLIALVVFFIVKGINKLSEAGKKKEEEKPAAPPEPPADVKLLTEIRDMLKESK